MFQDVFRNYSLPYTVYFTVFTTVKGQIHLYTVPHGYGYISLCNQTKSCQGQAQSR